MPPHPSEDFLIQELENYLSSLLAILNKAKPLIKSLPLDQPLIEIILKCVEGLQFLLAQEQSEYTELLNDTSNEIKETIVKNHSEREAKIAKLEEALKNRIITREEFDKMLGDLN
jgi:gas vesicle protein